MNQLKGINKNTSFFADVLSVNPSAEDSLISQIKKQIAWLIASQKLVEGNSLPSVRNLASQLNVNMHTVRMAYNRLGEEGLIELSPKSRARVLCYDPLRFAAQSGMINNHLVGIILPTLSNPFYQEFLKGVQSVADHDNTLILICSTYDDDSLAWRYYAQLVTSGVSGVISVSHDMREYFHSGLDKSKIPLVSADFPSQFGFSIELDHEKIGFTATNHLIQHGYQHIALVRFAVDIPSVVQIQRGYDTALQQAGLQTLPERIIHVNGFDRASGETAAKKLLALHDRPDSVFIIADHLALGVIQTFHKLGVNVPQDIAITSFNNIPEAAIIAPSLTTVAAPTEQLGRHSMMMLKELIAGQTPRQRHKTLPGSDLVIRQSCGCQYSSVSI